MAQRDVPEGLHWAGVGQHWFRHELLRLVAAGLREELLRRESHLVLPWCFSGFFAISVGLIGFAAAARSSNFGLRSSATCEERGCLCDSPRGCDGACVCSRTCDWCCIFAPVTWYVLSCIGSDS